MVLSSGGVNEFVEIAFTSLSRSIVCSFTIEPIKSDKECKANITYGNNCDMQLAVYSTSAPTTPLSTPPITFLNDVAEYCFTITASSGTNTVVVEGTLNVLNLGKDVLLDMGL